MRRDKGYNRHLGMLLGFLMPLTLGSCGTSSSSSESSVETDERTATVNALEAVPSWSLEDWVSYSDVAWVVSIVDEEQGILSDDTEERGEGYVAREVTAEVEDVLWKYDESLRSPESVTFPTAGWVMDEGTLIPAQFEGGVRLEVGGRYVIAMIDRSNGVFVPLGSGAVVQVRNDVVATTAHEADGRGSSMAAELDGLSLDTVAERIAGTAPNPTAEANRDLPPEERVQAAAEAERAD